MLRLCKITIIALAVVTGTFSALIRSAAANDVNDLVWRSGLSTEDSGFIKRIQDCCNCAPTDSDMQCFAECNAMLPRCRPPAPRAANPRTAGVACRSALTSYCCAGSPHIYYSRLATPLCPGAACTVTAWIYGKNHFLSGFACTQDYLPRGSNPN